MKTRYYKNNNKGFFKIEKEPDKRFRTGYKYVLYTRWPGGWYWKHASRCIKNARLQVTKIGRREYVKWENTDYRNYLQPITMAEAELLLLFEE